MHPIAVSLAHQPTSPDGVWSAWTLEPVALLLLLASALLYAVGAGRLRRRSAGRTPPARRAIAFYSGLTALGIALISPLHALGETLFSAHMVQHLVLVLVAAPLLCYGAPLLPTLFAIPAAVRDEVRYLQRALVPARGAWRNPLIVGGLHALALWSWHLPALYRAGLASEGLHALEHLSFLATGVLFWSLVIRSGPRRRLGYGAAILLVFATGLQSAALGAVLTFASRPLYADHIAGASVWGIGALADQQLAGLIMWVPMGAYYVVTMAVLMGRWLKDMERGTGQAVAVGAGDRT